LAEAIGDDVMARRVKPRIPGEDALGRQIGRRIRDLRRGRGLSQADLGISRDRRRTYLERQQISRIEQGRMPSLVVLLHVCDRLGVSITELIDE
jgi:transcriptional regulator with XRE-family HTH domain